MNVHELKLWIQQVVVAFAFIRIAPNRDKSFTNDLKWIINVHERSWIIVVNATSSILMNLNDLECTGMNSNALRMLLNAVRMLLNRKEW